MGFRDPFWLHCLQAKVQALGACIVGVCGSLLGVGFLTLLACFSNHWSGLGKKKKRVVKIIVIGECAVAIAYGEASKQKPDFVKKKATKGVAYLAIVEPAREEINEMVIF